MTAPAPPWPAELSVLVCEPAPDHALLDSGGGRKLERYGAIVVDRPEPQAMWAQTLARARWDGADAVFAGPEDEDRGAWTQRRAVAESWPMTLEGVRFRARLTGFRHLGVFPEQAPHWRWMRARLARISGERPRVLNLFAYTGVASLAAAQAGAEVVHVDASRKAIGWAKENQAEAGLAEAPIRWILEDARKFVEREGRRGRRYHGVLVDPPKFGRGPEGEVWDLFDDLAPHLTACAALLAPGPSFLIATAYAIRASGLALGAALAEALGGRPGRLETGELALREESAGRLLATSLFSRWAGDAG